MAASDVAVGIIFLSQTVVGALGNSSLLLHYLVHHLIGFKVRHTDLMIQHMFVANLLALLCRGVPQTVAAFGVKDFLSDVGCKLLFYLHRVGRGVSIGSTCLLSVFQAMKISPENSSCSELKVKAPKYIGFSIYLSWILYLIVNIMIFSQMTGKRSNNNITIMKDFEYCSAVQPDKSLQSLYAALITFPDVLCVGLMLWASSSMVLILHRHKQRMQQLRKFSSPRSSPESRATKTILLLVSTFVSFYTLSCIFQICVIFIYNPHWLLVKMAAIVAGSFPTLSPFLLMSRKSSASRLSLPWIRNRKTPNVRGMCKL